ncbi:MAG: hypothetical protein CMC70_04745 [Flavobacteriaceae bacterium]|nr:hypothetical protein [Flavobacteriaceae bacterium]|tara:strand:+ start:297 stop:650 length:354 start_codon:yes stop_codon:yes gene_type:complete
MTELQFLQQEVFKDVTNLNKKAEKAEDYKFSEEDFATVIERAGFFGISIYSINTWAKNTSFGATIHQDHNKKASDKRWYRKAFNTFKHRQEGLKYAATYKVPAKLLSRYTPQRKEEE